MSVEFLYCSVFSQGGIFGWGVHRVVGGFVFRVFSRNTIGISFFGWVVIVCDVRIALSWVGLMKVVVSGVIFM